MDSHDLETEARSLTHRLDAIAAAIETLKAEQEQLAFVVEELRADQEMP